jgi:predicted O-methyltransferase YrrM
MKHQLINIARALLPDSAMNLARDQRERRALGKIGRQNTDTSGLCNVDHFKNFKTFLNANDFLQDWNTTLERISKLVGNDNVGGGVNPGDRRALHTIIRTIKPANILEIGTHIGMSTYFLAEAAAINGNGKVTTVDILDVNNSTASWKRHGLKAPPSEIIAELGHAERTEFVIQPAQDYLSSNKNKFDLIFLDGDHTAQGVYQELVLALPALSQNGIIVMHDIYPNARPLFPNGDVLSGPIRGLERLIQESPELTYQSLSPLPWPTKEGTNITSLAVLLRKAA